MKRLAVQLMLSAVLGALVAGVAWAIGVTLLQSAVIAVCVVAVSAGRGVIEMQQRASGGEPWRGSWSHTRGGARRDVRQLGWRLRADRGRIHGAALQRLRRVARTRLRRHGIDLDDPDHAPAATALIGATAYRVLTVGPGHAVRYAAFVQALDALERRPASGRGTDGATTSTPTSIPEHR